MVTTPVFTLDLRVQPREFDGVAQIVFGCSSKPISGTKTSSLLLDGEVIAENLNGEGLYQLTLYKGGVITLTQNIYDSGSLVETLSATFLNPEYFTTPQFTLDLRPEPRLASPEEEIVCSSQWQSTSPPDSYATFSISHTSPNGNTEICKENVSGGATFMWHASRSLPGLHTFRYSITNLFGSILGTEEVQFLVSGVCNVDVKQRYPWNGLVDIWYEVVGLEPAESVQISFAALDKDRDVLASPLTLVDGSGLSTNGLNHVVWNASADIADGFLNSNTVVTARSSDRGLIYGAVQLWENGPWWATCNVGADSPEESGLYFWWGDTVGYRRENDKWVASDNIVKNFSFTSSIATHGKSLSELFSAGCTTSSSSDAVLNSKHDAATVHWGSDWRMPTTSELNALRSNCTSIWTTQKGVYGRLFTGKGIFSNSSIFIPATGYGDRTSLNNYGVYGKVWTSSPYASSPNHACDLYFYSGNVALDYYYRYIGFPVRAVRDRAP